VSQSISFLLPVKNVEKYFENITANLVSNLELTDEAIIIDDSSDDNSYSLLSNWAKTQNGDVKVTRNTGAGLVDALNLGLKLAKYDWIARFDADDVYPCNRIREQRQHIDVGVAVIFSDYTINHSMKKFSAYVPSAVFDPQVRISLISGNRTPHPSALMNKTYVTLVGGYDSNYFPAEDLALWFKVSGLGSLISVPKNLLNYYRNTNSVTSLKQAEMIKKKSFILEQMAPQMISEVFQQRNFITLYRQYRGVSRASSRRLLLIKDLVLCGKFAIDKKNHYAKLLVMLAFALFDLRNFWGAGALSLAKLKLYFNSVTFPK
jgi:glycosyltransferase involved in cell wall biosynthesis